MPHDKNGAPLSVGDRVNIKAVITSTSEGEEYCNLSLETEEVMFPGNNKTVLSLNAKQVVRETEDGRPTINEPGSTEGPGDKPPDPPSGGG